MRPKRIILLRHAEAQGNVDDRLFQRIPDHRMALTDRGWEQARAAARGLATALGGEEVRVYLSPYRRTRETYVEVAKALGERIVHAHEEPRLREQDWGNLQDWDHVQAQKRERNDFGHFFYRFSDGESGADVFDRVSTFLETMHRDFARDDFPDNALLITHGLTIRLFLMRWFHWSVEYFESLDNPALCATLFLDRQTNGSYRLRDPLSQWQEATPTRVGPIA